MRKLFFLLAILCWSGVVYSQSVSQEELELAKSKIEKCNDLYFQSAFDEIFKLTKEAYAIASRDTSMCDSLIAQIYYIDGRAWLRKGDFALSEKLVNKSLKKRIAIFGKLSNPVLKSLTLLSQISYSSYNYKKAEKYSLESWEILDSMNNEKNKNWPTLFINLGGNYYAQSDYQNSSLFFEKAIQSIETIYGDNHVDLCVSYINLGAANEGAREFESAITNFRNAKKIYYELENSLSPYYLAHIYFCLGSPYYKLEEYETGIENYKEALATLAQLKTKEYKLSALIQKKMGDCYIELGELENASFYYSESIHQYEFLPEGFQEDLYHSKLGLAQTYTAQKEFQKALNLYNETFSELEFLEGNFTFEKLMITPKMLAWGLSDKTNSLLEKFRAEQNADDLMLALTSAESAISILDTIKLNIKESASKQILIDEFYIVYENAIEVNYLLYALYKDLAYVNAAFELAEKSKNTQLLDAVLKTKAESFAGIPDELLQKEQQIQMEITTQKKQKHQIESAGAAIGSEELNAANKDLFDLKLQQEKLIQNFEKNFPKYYSLKYATNKMTPSNVQESLLNEEKTIVEYFVGDNAIYVFVINKEDLHFKKLDPSFDFKSEINNYYHSLRDYRTRSVTRDSLVNSYALSAHSLYQYLIQPIESYLKEKLIIIPDGLLNYVPFTALLKTYPENNWAFKNHDYLLHHHSISYNYSTSLMKEMGASPDNKAYHKLLAIAPSFQSPYGGETLRSSDLMPLEHNEKEIETILKLCKGTALTQSEANKENFIQNASNYRAIHFATHGVANEKSGAYSYIAFTQDEHTNGDENILFGVDIYNLELNADMVVLSACETAAGELKRGEGVISTARAFSYAGAQNLITTLWKVSDAKATDLMSLFYRKLQQKKQKDYALREATQLYLESNEDMLAHPFFWASFITIGNTDAIELEKPLSMLTMGLLLLACLFGIGLLWRFATHRGRNPVEKKQVARPMSMQN